MMNQVMLVGRLTKDPELRYTPSGIAQTRVTLAIQRNYKNGQGEYETDFIQVTIWRKQAENTANFMRKGGIIGVTGRIQTRNYEGQDGKRVYVTEVIASDVSFINSNRQAGDNGGYNQQGGQGNQGGGGYNQRNNQGNQGGQGGGGYNQRNNQQDPFDNNQPDPFAQGRNQSRIDDDPFATSKGPIEISEDDLPF